MANQEQQNKPEPKALITEAIRALSDALARSINPIEHIRLQAQVEILQAILQNL